MCHQGFFSRLYGRAKTNRCTRVNSVIFSNKPLLLQDYFDWPGFCNGWWENFVTGRVAEEE